MTITEIRDPTLKGLVDLYFFLLIWVQFLNFQIPFSQKLWSCISLRLTQYRLYSHHNPFGADPRQVVYATQTQTAMPITKVCLVRQDLVTATLKGEV